MKFLKTWRWFGPSDSITLDLIKETNVTGVVTALHHLPIGVTWPLDELLDRKKKIEKTGLIWSVVESIPVHEDIKRRTGKYREYIENYKQSIANLGKCGIPVLCYNFMPVLDWTRTDLDYDTGSGYTSLRFDESELAAFDIHILKRPGAENDYSDEILQSAGKLAGKMDAGKEEYLKKNILAGLPGSEAGYTLDEFQKLLDSYREISDEALRDNLYHFLREIIPAAQEANVKLAIHPDDPPFPLFGLPRVVSTEDDARRVTEVIDTPVNGLTFCTGSYGASADNDVVGMSKRLAHRFNFLHLRNVHIEHGRTFHEALHIKGSVDMERVIYNIILDQERRKKEGRTDLAIPFRPDHGHNILRSNVMLETAPGYSYIGRLRGLAVIRGVEMGIRAALKFQREHSAGTQN